jgi:hypothetical protein
MSILATGITAFSNPESFKFRGWAGKMNENEIYTGQINSRKNS